MKSNLALSLGLAALVGLGAVLPAAAQTTTAKPATTAAAAPAAAKKFYVSLKSGSKGCEVVSVKPTSKMMVGKHSFKTEADASKALAADKACKA
ncbi:MAG: hypothetical protein U1E16_03225 [Hyphomicrobiales bacterium]|uniref:hypothetical protein n=1 Tax=Aestuariivirga sp. TaxID=2650926 RepID=UPI0035B36B0E